MAERSRSISQKWYNIGAFSRIYKQLITKFPRKKISASRKSMSNKVGADHPKVHEEEINEKQVNYKNGGIRSSSRREIIKHQIHERNNNCCYFVGSPPSPSPSPSRSTSPNLNSSRSSTATPPPMRSSSSRRNSSPLNSSSSSRNHDNKNNIFHPSGNLSPSPLSRNRSTGTSLLRNISKRNNSSNNNYNYNGINDSPTPAASSGSFTRSVSQRSSNLIMYSNSNGVVKPPTLEETLECTLEELCFGCIKKIKTTRDAIANDGQIIEEHEEVLTIKVQPGWRNGTKITFEGMGKGSSSSSNSSSSSSCCGITFTVAEKEHQVFRREGNDLELGVEISLMEALTGCTVPIPLLSGEKMSLSINDVIEPGYRKIISGQGMTKPQEQGKRGNLIITFLVKFPIQLTKQQSSDIIRILKHSS